ncbi:MAG: hypothetical protein QG670_1987 [Thermoproteota archaeon]|nr:hypothetical protein [Thermoproteota archaeon]
MSFTLKGLASTEISKFAKSPVRIFGPEDTVSQVLGELEKTDRYEALVFCESKYGIVTIRDLLCVEEQPELQKLGEHSKRQGALWASLDAASPTNTVAEVADYLICQKAHAIPIIENSRAVGIVSQAELSNALCNIPELSNISASKFLRRPVITLDAGETVAKARSLMLEKGFSHLPITKNNKLVGILTAKILANLFLVPLGRTTRGELAGDKPHRLSASAGSVMETSFVTVGLKASVLDVASRMRDQRRSACLFVDDSGFVQGIITPLDLLELLIPEKKNELPIYITGLTEKESFFEKAVAEEKLRRVIERNMKIHTHITEVSVVIKQGHTAGERVLYQTTARVLSPFEQFEAKAEGWDLMVVFEELCNKLDRILRSKKHMPKGPRRFRRPGRKATEAS